MERPKGKHAWTVKVGEKGQIVIPKEARQIFGIDPGDTLIILGEDEKGKAIPPKSMLTSFAALMFQEPSEEEENE